MWNLNRTVDCSHSYKVFCLHQDEDADNLAEWIGAKNVDTDGATSSEFDQFLAERAAAGDTPRRQDK